jgi:hypothetical protein
VKEGGEEPDRQIRPRILRHSRMTETCAQK